MWAALFLLDSFFLTFVSVLERRMHRLVACLLNPLPERVGYYVW